MNSRSVAKDAMSSTFHDGLFDGRGREKILLTVDEKKITKRIKKEAPYRQSTKEAHHFHDKSHRQGPI